MKNVTELWRRRDGKPLIAVYRGDGGDMVQVIENKWLANNCHGLHIGSRTESGNDLLPVPREPTYRPFRDLAEAFSVMGPTPFVRDKGKAHWQILVTWDTADQTIWGCSMKSMFEGAEWTDNPSDTVGKPCGVEVPQ